MNGDQIVARAKQIDFSMCSGPELLAAAEDPTEKPLEYEVALLMELAKRARIRREAKGK